MRGRGFLQRFRREQSGVAAIEAGLISGILAMVILNVAELGRYAYLATQVTAASQAGAHAAIVGCDIPDTPVTLNCSNVDTLVGTAIQGTSLGDKVSLHTALDERWYCVNPGGDLQEMAPAGDKPIHCGGAGISSLSPVLMLRVQTAYAYEPIFPGLTLVEGFPSTIVRTAWMRLL